MNLKAVCFGEILWDIFPDKERIGGAPLNVASRLRASGIETDIISRVGNDQKGQDLLSYLETNKIGTKFITSDLRYPTGMVNVTLNAAGSATYDIAYPSAWDKIEFDVEMTKALAQADVFIFGSLVCRDEISRKTLLQLLPHSHFKVFDLNLRPPHYEKDLLVELMESADFIKFNDEELLEIAHLLDSPYNSLEQNLEFISEKTNSKQICVTKGSKGAVLLMHYKLFYNSGYPVKVKDTVGAGDSFLASLISKLLKKEDPQAAIDYACAVGALVAAKEGANLF
jgi:fructokinase